MIRRKPKSAAVKIAVVIALTTLVVIALIVLAMILLHKPWLDDNVPWTTVSPSETKAPGSEVTDPSDDKYKRDQNLTNFLVLGRDRVANLTDVIMVIQFNTSDHSVSIMQIPRDTYSVYGSSYHKINGLFSYCMVQNEYKVKEAMESAVGFVQQNLNIKIDYYVLMNLDALVDVVDAIGGVEVDVPSDMSYEDPDQDLLINLKAGVQTLTGKQAEGFVRFRSGYIEADAGRVDAQKIFLSAFAKQFKEKVSISNIDSLVTTAYKNITTNMSVADIVYYAKEARSVDVAKAKFISLPYGDAREDVNSGQWYVVINRKATLDAINGYFNVYDKDVDDATFDAARAFTNVGKAHINEHYIAEGQSAKVTTMENVIDEGIDIPTKK